MTLSQSKFRPPGFTLIEILLVLGIIAMVMSLGLPAIERVTYQRINSTTRKFVGLVRTIRNDSILLNSVHRIVVDFDRKAYWVEVQKEPRLISEQPEEPKKKANNKEAPVSNFSFAEKYSDKPIPWPGGVAIEAVRTERDDLLNQGTAYVHFFPSGYNEQAILYFSKEGSPGKGYSLVIRPTSGRVLLVRSFVKDFDSEEIQ
jgi:prepilin-type N-terminal cleavage/methylation domain-containing protein